jgi:formylglycine-generating enzyme required for sulfatase activity
MFVSSCQKEDMPDDDKYMSINIGGVTFKMIKVEGGTFTMGASDSMPEEFPPHRVTVSTFYIGETEVTQELWQAVMGNNPSYFSGSQNPVAGVNWSSCQTFIKELNALTGKQFRLPTEAEWEFAARGGNKSRGYKYAGSDTLRNVAWYRDNSNNQTREVARKSPNELGLYDMSGNVCEWCQDRYGSYSSTSQTNPTGPASGTERVFRGGSWGHHYWQCLVSSRFGSLIGMHYVGLRLAL